MEQSFEPRILPAVERVFQERSIGLDEPMASEYRDIKTSIQNPDFMKRLQLFSPSTHA